MNIRSILDLFGKPRRRRLSSRIHGLFLFIASLTFSPYTQALDVHFDSPVKVGTYAYIQGYNGSRDTQELHYYIPWSPDGPTLTRDICNESADNGGHSCAPSGAQATPGWIGNCRHACDTQAISYKAGTHRFTVTELGVWFAPVIPFDITWVADVPNSSKSSIRVSTNGQTANGSNADVLTVSVADQYENPVSGANVVFSGATNIKMNGGRLGSGAACTTDGSGSCSVTTTTTVAASYSSSVTAAGYNIGNLNYNFVAGPASAGNSSTRVSTNGQIANAVNTDQFTTTVRDAYNNPVSNVLVSHAATSGVNLGGGVGIARSCTTDAAGTCVQSATATVATSYSTQVSVAGSAIATLSYNFVPGPAAGAHSGVRVVTNNVFADGTTQDVLEVLLRDLYDNTLVANTVVNFASPGASVAFNGTARGTAGSCTTSGASGTCQVKAVDFDPVGGDKSSAVTVGGVALGGSFTVGTATYGSSPASFRFAPWVPRLQIVKRTTNGVASHDFSFTMSGVQASTDTITVAGTGTGLGSHFLGYLPAPSITITELASTAWPDAPVSASCVDLSSATPTATFGTLLGNRLLVSPAQTPAGSNLVCTFVNTRSAAVSGQVFSDTGLGGGGIANDGISNGGEPGLPTVQVELNDCGATVYSSALTDGSGRYSLKLPTDTPVGARRCVDTPRDASRQSTGGSVSATVLPIGRTTNVSGTGYTYGRTASADRIAFIVAGTSGDSIAGLNFGSVPPGTLVLGGLQAGSPGAVVNFPHVFTAGTGGNVTFSVPSSVSSPPLDGWVNRVYADPGCTNRHAPGAALLYPPAVTQAVTAGQRFCVVLQVTSPALAPSGSRNQSTLQADFRYANITPALSATYSLEDGTTVSPDVISLVMDVRNVTQGVATYGVSNDAKPGETLEYRITFNNNVAAPVKNLVIHNATPAYTSFVSADTGVTPPGITACTKLTPASPTRVDCAVGQAAGGKGSLEWRFTGPLEPGASGTVLFRVKLD